MKDILGPDFHLDNTQMVKCKKCFDTGWFKYDSNHSTVCDACCKHDKGSWLLERHYGEKNGRWCCRAGCGHTRSEQF